MINKFVTSCYKSLVILRIWLALCSAINSQITLFYALNHTFLPANEKRTLKPNNQSGFKACLKKQMKLKENERERKLLCGKFCFTFYFHFFFALKKKMMSQVVIELSRVQFWSEIILVISNRTHTVLSFTFEVSSEVWFQTKLKSKWHYIKRKSQILKPNESHITPRC